MSCWAEGNDGAHRRRRRRSEAGRRTGASHETIDVEVNRKMQSHFVAVRSFPTLITLAVPLFTMAMSATARRTLSQLLTSWSKWVVGAILLGETLLLFHTFLSRLAFHCWRRHLRVWNDCGRMRSQARDYPHHLRRNGFRSLHKLQRGRRYHIQQDHKGPQTQHHARGHCIAYMGQLLHYA